MKKLLAILVLFVLLVTLISQRLKSPPTPAPSYFDDQLVFNENQPLLYFYEPPTNKTETDYRDWLHYSPVYNYNSDSLNDRFNYPAEKPDNVFRIITLGDSNTEGKFVNTKESYPEQLEELLNQKCAQTKQFEVINFGVSGYDLQYSYERYKKRGIKYQPDLVLWLISGTGFNKVLEKIYPISQSYLKNMNKSGELKSYESRGVYYPFEIQAINEFLKKYGHKQHTDYQKSVLTAFRKTYSGPLVLMAIDKVDPSKFPPEIAVNLDQEYKKTLAEITDSNTYLYPNLPTLEEPNQRLIDLHPSSLGHNIFAKSIFGYLISNRLLDCGAKDKLDIDLYN